MRTTFLYNIAKVFPLETGGFAIEAPSFEATTEASLDEVLKAVPNLVQEEEKGGWETYGTMFLGSTVVFLLRKSAPLVLTPTGSIF
jgi:hypothetical protein